LPYIRGITEGDFLADTGAGIDFDELYIGWCSKKNVFVVFGPLNEVNRLREAGNFIDLVFAAGRLGVPIAEKVNGDIRVIPKEKFFAIIGELGIGNRLGEGCEN